MKVKFAIVLAVLATLWGCATAPSYPGFPSYASQLAVPRPSSYTARAGELQTATLFDSGPFVCEGTVHKGIWRNEVGSDIYIRAVQIWMGVDYGSVADIWTSVNRESDGMLLSRYGQDAYAPGRSPHQWINYFAPDYILLKNGDGLVVSYACTGGKRMQSMTDIWYLTQIP